MGPLIEEVQEHQSKLLWEINPSAGLLPSNIGVAWKQLVMLSSAIELLSLNLLNLFVVLIQIHYLLKKKKQQQKLNLLHGQGLETHNI